jgi:hypothetical protein
MYTQNKARSLRIKANLRRVSLATFAVCFFACAALLSVISGRLVFPEGRTAYAAGDAHSDCTKCDDSDTLGGYGDGGTEETAYLIGNAIQLQDLANKVNGLAPYENTFANMSGKFIKLVADIDLSELPDYNVGEGWTPIGNASENDFSGNFDGDGFEVSNLYINITSGGVHVGLFGFIIFGAISNLGVSGEVNVSGNKVYAGGIAGVICSSSIKNCYNTSVVTATSTNDSINANIASAGGIAGQSYAYCNIENCYNTGAVTATSSKYINVSDAFVGGIVGWAFSGDIIINCYNTGVVTGSATTSHAGGISGYLGNIENCYNTGVVTGSATANSYAGGIIGYLYPFGLTIESCYYNKEIIDDGVGYGHGPRSGYTGLTAEEMTADNVLTAGGAMSGLGAAFEKRANDEVNKIAYYPELAVFKNSSNEAVRKASQKSVAPTSSEDIDEEDNVSDGGGGDIGDETGDGNNNGNGGEIGGGNNDGNGGELSGGYDDLLLPVAAGCGLLAILAVISKKKKRAFATRSAAQAQTPEGGEVVNTVTAEGYATGDDNTGGEVGATGSVDNNDSVSYEISADNNGEVGEIGTESYASGAEGYVSDIADNNNIESYATGGTDNNGGDDSSPVAPSIARALYEQNVCQYNKNEYQYYKYSLVKQASRELYEHSSDQYKVSYDPYKPYDPYGQNWNKKV